MTIPPQQSPSIREAVRLYSVATVADLLEVSTDFVYDRIKSGVLPVVELGDTKAKQRIRADALQDFIDSRTFGSWTATSGRA
jgi:excisionase family DNA binding protein